MEAIIPIQTTAALTSADRWDHILARWGVKRSEHRVEPGLYALGSPTPQSRVFVTANYTLSFDALRSSLAGVDGYILVLDTKGINVWCAAGKGTFGTDELVHRVETSRLGEVVEHRTLILPQLGAPGVSAHEVSRRSGFKVEYGPVRAADLREYLDRGQATPEMRRVRFSLPDRLTLVPVELVHVAWPTLLLAVILGLLVGPLAGLAVVTAVLAGAALFPALLPWLPTAQFSSKGFILGAAVALPFAILALVQRAGGDWWMRVGWMLAYLLAMPPVTAYLALNFTGSTTFTSKSGVAREMKRYIPIIAWTFGVGVLLTVALALIRWFA
jgi:hypothetical protein